MDLLIVNHINNTTRMSKTREELKSLLDSFEEATQFWINSLSDISTFSEIKAAKVSDPINELNKLVKLIKAHTTKVGIIFKPENLRKEVNPAFNTLLKLSETLVLTVSVIVQIDSAKISKLFYNEIVEQLKQLLESNNRFAKELKLIFEDDEDVSEQSESKKNEMDGRLVSVGRVWSNCDSLVQLLTEGNLALLTNKIKQSILLLEDGFEEFAEWTENPEEMNDDPFGFSDEEDFTDDEEEATPPVMNGHKVTEDDKELIKYAKKWLKKIELVKLLIASFKKSLPKSTPGDSIDEIYTIQNHLVSLIDKFIVELMLERRIDDNEYTDSITNESIQLSKIARNLHNDKKTKWYETWETKYNSL